MTTTADSDALYPVRQFQGHTPLPRLGEVLAVLRPQLDQWSLAQWLLTPTAALDGRSAAQLLGSGEAEAVLRWARREAARLSS